MDILSIGLAWYVVFVFSATVHEAAHALVAMKLGDLTAYHGGQVTLDPLPHIRREPFGMLVVPVVSYLLGGWMFGWASAPYDPYWAARHPKRAAMMGLAGPAGNLFLVILAGAAIRVGITTEKFYIPDIISFVTVAESHDEGLFRGLAILLSIMFSLNLLLFVFNLLPIAPLDGTAWMEFVLTGDTLIRYRQAMGNPTVRIFGIIIAWNIFGYVFRPIHAWALGILYPGHHWGAF